MQATDTLTGIFWGVKMHRGEILHAAVLCLAWERNRANLNPFVLGSSQSQLSCCAIQVRQKATTTAQVPLVFELPGCMIVWAAFPKRYTTNNKTFSGKSDEAPSPCGGWWRGLCEKHRSSPPTTADHSEQQRFKYGAIPDAYIQRLAVVVLMLKSQEQVQWVLFL